MDATGDFDLDAIRREIAARSSVSLWDPIPGNYKIFILLNSVALRLSQSSASFTISWAMLATIFY